METPKSRSPRRTATGVVVSDKMAKTITVRVDRRTRHPKYGKYVTRSWNLKAHDERGQAKKGDLVEVAWARRLSKTKFWTLVRIVSKARVEAVRGEAEIPVPAPKAAPAPEPAPAAVAEAEGAGKESSS